VWLANRSWAWQFSKLQGGQAIPANLGKEKTAETVPEATGTVHMGETWLKDDLLGGWGI
jgi:hypothetical protein